MSECLSIWMPGCPGIIPALPRSCPVVVHPFVNPVVNPLLNPFVKLCVAHHRHTLPDTSHSTKEHALAWHEGTCTSTRTCASTTRNRPGCSSPSSCIWKRQNSRNSSNLVTTLWRRCRQALSANVMPRCAQGSKLWSSI